MVRATLIHNASAGGASLATSEDLVAALRAVGLEAEHRPTEQESDLDGALADPGDLVVAAGGDGTIRAVVTRLAGRGVPLVVLPLGTANNFAASLGLSGGPLELIAGLGSPERRPVDVGRARGPWGERVFLEAAGIGVFASAMAAYGPDDGKSPLRAITAAVQTLPGYAAIACCVTLDGVEQRKPLVLVEAMNTPAVGPRLRFAPGADPGDGVFDVVMIEEDGRVGLTSYLTGIVAGRLESLPNVTVTRARSLRLEWTGAPLHADAEILGAEGEQWAELTLEPGAIEVWLPGTVTATSDAESPALAGASP